VVPITRVGITFRQRVVDEHRYAPCGSQRNRSIERRVFVRSHGGAGPVEDVLAGCQNLGALWRYVEAFGER
jgi:hypothetical protein